MAKTKTATMKRYAVSGTVTASVYTEVEATSEAEARKIAMDRGIDSLCHQCDGGSEGDSERVWVWNAPGDGGVEAITSTEEIE